MLSIHRLSATAASWLHPPEGSLFDHAAMPSSGHGLQMKTGMTGAPTSNEPMRAGLSHSRRSLLNHNSTGRDADGEQGKPTTCCWPPALRLCRLFLERFVVGKYYNHSSKG
ncbi:hypothetical protein INR49_007856 [Caranx melampygus]|nr:hypothetical protein INR49_007856 [Caranx melampygus]